MGKLYILEIAQKLLSMSNPIQQFGRPQDMARLAKIDSFIVDLPTIRPHVLAMATMHRQSMVIVRITDADGGEGIGEGTTIGGLSYGDESPEGIKLAIDTYIAPLLETIDIACVGAAMAVVGKYVVGNHIAKCAVEAALLDLAGKRLGVPVSELIAGAAAAIPSPSHGLWPAATPPRILTKPRPCWRGAVTISSSLKSASAASRPMSPMSARSRLRWAIAPACGSMSIKAGAGDRGMAMLEDVGCDLVEQPVARHAISAMARLSARHAIPMMADERCTARSRASPSPPTPPRASMPSRSPSPEGCSRRIRSG
jgi:muconate cycloisomerase